MLSEMNLSLILQGCSGLSPCLTEVILRNGVKNAAQLCTDSLIFGVPAFLTDVTLLLLSVRKYFKRLKNYMAASTASVFLKSQLFS